MNNPSPLEYLAANVIAFVAGALTYSLVLAYGRRARNKE